MRVLHLLLAAAGTAVLAAGCSCIPPGQPPPGAIVANPGSSGTFSTRQAARNYLITSLADYLLTNRPGREIMLDCDAGALAETAAVLKAAGMVSGVTPAIQSDLRLTGRTVPGGWELALYRNDAELWRGAAVVTTAVNQDRGQRQSPR